MTLTPAAYAEATLPPELMFNNAPIDALCFESVSADEWLDIAKCSAKEIIRLPESANAGAAGRIGYRYRYKEETADAMSSSYYQYLGMWNGSPIVVGISNGGGTGEFTSLMSVERNANSIRVLQGFGAGDRCNGGIVDAKIEGGALHYGQNMTPIDFLQMADDNPNDLQPYEDLEASASSCFGIARFEDEKFIGVTLQPLPDEGADASMQYKYQPCFNKLYQVVWGKGKKALSVAELKEFTGQFNAACVVDGVSPGAGQ